MIRIKETLLTQIAKTLAIFFIASVLLNPSAAAQHSKGAAEYLIVEYSDQLIVYNQYQQRITQQEKEAFIPFAPLKILESNSVLSDNYTPCIKVELDGSVFYLIKNDRTSLVGVDKLGLNQIYRNVVSLQDTVQLMTKSSAVLISPDKTQRSALRNGQELIRYFQDGDMTYIRSLVAPFQFGWVRFSGIVHAIPLQRKELDNNITSSITDKTLERIKVKLREVNSLLTNIFMYFNKQAIQKKTIPQWHFIESEKSVEYVLEPQLYGLCFPETDRYLTRDLDNILLGTGYTLSYKPGKIEIQQK